MEAWFLEGGGEVRGDQWLGFGGGEGGCGVDSERWVDCDFLGLVGHFEAVWPFQGQHTPKMREALLVEVES